MHPKAGHPLQLHPFPAPHERFLDDTKRRRSTGGAVTLNERPLRLGGSFAALGLTPASLAAISAAAAAQQQRQVAHRLNPLGTEI